MSFPAGAQGVGAGSASGDATYQIPIPAPAGTGGHQPSLALRYSSSDGDGPFGIGWTIGLSEIRRTLRFGTPAYDATDRFERGGQLLIQDASTPEYRTDVESFARIEHNTGGTDEWVVTTPDGTISRYGTTQASRIRKGGDTNPSDDSGPVFRWLLSEIEDVNGNIILYDYDRTLDPGTGYPAAIRDPDRRSDPLNDASISSTRYAQTRRNRTLGRLRVGSGNAPSRSAAPWMEPLIAA